MLYLSPGITVYCCIVMAIFGACMGSFLNCCSWRILHGEAITKGRSHCDACGHILKVRDLIPIVSFLLSGGKCRYCGEKLSLRHVLAELAGAIAFVGILLKFDISLQLLQMMIFTGVLLAVSLTDLEGMLIPDRFILIGIASGLLFPALGPEPLVGMGKALLGGFSVAGVLLLVVLVAEKIMKKEAMGGGDIKLLFVTGLHLGWANNVLCLLLACILGIFFGLASQKREQPFPWGPSIALAAWLCCLFGNEIIAGYLSLF